MSSNEQTYRYFTGNTGVRSTAGIARTRETYPGAEDWLEEKLQQHKRKYEAAAWYNPEDGWIHVGEQSIAKPVWGDRAYNVNAYKQLKKMIKEGSIVDKDKLDFSCWRPGYWQELANKVLKYKSSGGFELQNPSLMREAAAGNITSDDSPSIAVIQILAEILGRDTRTYTLTDAVSHASTPNLALSVDTWNGFGVSRDVPEGVEALTQKGKFVRKEYLIQKDVAHVFVTDEALLRADRDLMQTHISHSGSEMTLVKNLKVANELEAATAVAGTDWTALDAGGFHFAADPASEIGALAEVIEDNGGDPNTIASHVDVFRKYLRNGTISGIITPGADLELGSKVIARPPGLPMFAWYLDNLKTKHQLTIYDKNAVLFMQGPVRTGTYRQEARGGEGYITRDWSRCVVIDTSRIRNLTGISS